MSQNKNRPRCYQHRGRQEGSKLWTGYCPLILHQNRRKSK
nr:MAG TPA: hypothetical protein [Bacteriophage sp.]